MDLLKDYKSYCNLITLKNDEDSKIYYESDHALVIYKECMDCTFVACDDESEIENCLRYVTIKPNTSFCIQHTRLLNYIPPLANSFQCCNYVYDKDNFEFKQRNDIEIRVLDESYFDFVFEHYDGYNNPDYIMERLGSGNLWGHSMKVNVLDLLAIMMRGPWAYYMLSKHIANKELGEYLESFLIHKSIQDKRIPFAQVYPGNIASEHLQRKLGLVPSDNVITWGGYGEQ
ncbi:MAG: hypothetical protein ACK5L6_13235 [Anaerorhabdus sp.]|uniref:hypothetical protein n=1 Tax=Anaerorhabdus sp. TaxID=1872524 RepID=UPI003A851FAD